MRSLIFMLSVCFIANSSIAQICNQYIYMKSGSKIEMTHYDKKNKLSSVTTSEVIEVLNENGGYKADIRTSMKDDEGEEMHNADIEMSCKNDVLTVSIHTLLGPDQLKSFEDMEVKIEETNIDYLGTMTVGSTLANGNFKAHIYANETKIMTMTFDVSDRVVAGKESVTTTAGTFDCFKITYKAKFKALLSSSADITEWWSPSVGIVKSESYRNGKIQGSSQLTKYTK